MSLLAEEDTIAAIATARGEASVGMVRVSGPQAEAVARRVFRSPLGHEPKLGPVRQVRYGYVIDPLSMESLDEAMLVWMPGPKSYTAEDVVELQVHGGTQVVETVLMACLRADARLAEPGEFTKRAFLNGRIDLSQAEAVIDLIRAKTDLARKSALNQVKGRFRDRVQGLRKRLLTLQAHVEVTLDYPEHDAESAAVEVLTRDGQGLLEEIHELIHSAEVGKILRDGVYTAIVGRPNVGKSSLLNALLRRERAIVTDIPGTTRDVLEEYINLRGIPFKIADTAGIRETSDVVEKIGVERSRATAEAAEVVVLVINGHEPLTVDDEQLFEQTQGLPRIVVLNKADLEVRLDVERMRELAGESPVVAVSAKAMDGLALLEEALEKMVLGAELADADAGYMANARQQRLLEEAENDLQIAIDASKQGVTLDIVAVQLQAVYAALGRIIGEEVGEDLLDEIFTRFCLGK